VSELDANAPRRQYGFHGLAALRNDGWVLRVERDRQAVDAPPLMDDVAVSQIKAKEVGIPVGELVEIMGRVPATRTAVWREATGGMLQLRPAPRPPPVTDRRPRDASQPGNGAVVEPQLD